MASTNPRRAAGEFLLMLLIAVAIIGILAGMLAPALANKLDDAQIRAEREVLKALRSDFEATFDSTDFDNLNEASLPGSGLPSGTTFTTFDDGTGIASRIYGRSVVVDPAGWVTKLAQKRGVTSYQNGASYTAQTQNQYAAIAFNSYNVQRCLILGPIGETGQQRYMLMSMMVPPYRT
jgi:type II secretory pathway pseudopilin PulG